MERTSASASEPFLRLLQVSDSAFPVGGYAYSHGLEWLVHEGRVTSEGDLAEVMQAYIEQPLRRQALPAALRAFRARSDSQAVRIDAALDASVMAESERDAGRAMGTRLLETAAESHEGAAATAHLAAVRAGHAPGQYAVAFALVARDAGCDEATTLAALAHVSCSSIVSAAVRLGVIGQSASARIIAAAAPRLSSATADIQAQRRPSIGAFAPQLELATLLQSTLQFRMFAS